MILVRDVFLLHFGKAREALELAREGAALERRAGYPAGRLLADLTGEYYTLVAESDFTNLSEFEAALAQVTGDPEWRAWYGRFTPLVRSGRREVFRIADEGSRGL